MGTKVIKLGEIMICEALGKFVHLSIPEKNNIVSKSGLILTKDAASYKNDAMIRSIGPEVPEGIFEVGDYVIYNPYSSIFFSEGEFLIDYNFIVGKMKTD